jgi:hypothetical protein
MHNPERCDRRGCARPVITTFCKEALCLDHFCSRSYEFLSATDERGQLSTASNLPTAEQIQTADECARRTLAICMSKMLLNNLERARLLDILLWCGDLVSFPGAKKNSSAAISERGRHQNLLPAGKHRESQSRTSCQAATGLRFFVASKKLQTIGGKSYKADEETTARVENSDLLKITKQAV